jgi:hypothetical protein
MKLFVRLSPDMRYEEILKAEMEDGGGGWVGGWVGGILIPLSPFIPFPSFM